MMMTIKHQKHLMPCSVTQWYIILLYNLQKSHVTHVYVMNVVCKTTDVLHSEEVY